MKSVTCDNCGTTERDGVAAPEGWFKVGPRDGYQEDACTAACAHALIDADVALSEEIAAEIEKAAADG